MKLSTRAEYGLRMCFLLALNGGVLPLSMLVRQTGLSEKYLEQLLGMLKKAGIIETKRGINGGYCLTKPPHEISVNQILSAVDDNFEFADCLKGGCNDQYCPNRRLLKRIYENINGVLNDTTLKDMLDDNTKCGNT